MIHHALSHLVIVGGGIFIGVVTLLVILGIVGPPVEAFLVLVALGTGALGVGSLFIAASRSPQTFTHERFRDQWALVTDALAPTGRVSFHGEDWAARLDDAFATQHIGVGQQVRVIGVEDLCLIVTPSVLQLVEHVHNHLIAQTPPQVS